MNDNKQPIQYYLVGSDALPEVFVRVTQAKELLDVGEASTVAEAAEMVGISRSAYYKYRDSVMPFRDLARGHIVTFQLILRDRPGVLTALLGEFAANSANILTINQSIPTNGTAPVTISIDTAQMECTTEQMLTNVTGVTGVVKAAVLAG